MPAATLDTYLADGTSAPTQSTTGQTAAAGELATTGSNVYLFLAIAASVVGMGASIAVSKKQTNLV